MKITRDSRITGTNRIRKAGSSILILFITFGLSACYYGPHGTAAYPQSETIGTPPVALSTQVYFYPKHGQSTEQQSRDHYDCYNWAVKETGFDPGQSSIPNEQRIRVVPMPPAGYDTAAMAVAGAVLGALFGGPRHAVEGAMIGATSGAIAGVASDSARQEEARIREEQYASRNRSRDTQLTEKTSHFRRAMSACLEGRGYTVR